MPRLHQSEIRREDCPVNREIFCKFPVTPHLAVPSGMSVRSDKVMTKNEREEFLKNELIIEEKVDGANLGISFDSYGNVRVQNRGEYLEYPYAGQWKRLNEWLELRTDRLFEELVDRYILFGEWCYAKHSISYDHLPDWFLGFDILDKKGMRFLSSARRDLMLSRLRLATVPMIGKGRFSRKDLDSLLTISCLGKEYAEGLYLRLEERDWLKQRAKLIRPAFTQSMEQHWSRCAIKQNTLISP